MDLFTLDLAQIQKQESKDIIKEKGLNIRLRLPVSLVYTESFSTRIESRRREAQVKKWSKIKRTTFKGEKPNKIIE